MFRDQKEPDSLSCISEKMEKQNKTKQMKINLHTYKHLRLHFYMVGYFETLGVTVHRHNDQ